MNPLIGTRWKYTEGDYDLCTSCMGRYRDQHGSYAATYFISIQGGNTLGQPSGKFDYHVKYTIPDNWKPVSQTQIAATGWDDDSTTEDNQPKWDDEPRWDTSPEEQDEESNNSSTEGGGEETKLETTERVETEAEAET